MIPPFDTDGNLPPGIYEATWDEFKATFGGNPHRERLIEGLYRAAAALKAAGCSRVYVDGSFVTAKDRPGDFDGCWDPTGVDQALLDPVLLDFRNGRITQKLKYGGELFLAVDVASMNPAWVFLDFFQRDKATGNRKGIVALDLRRLP